LLREGGIERGDAGEMFIAAALGMLKTGETAAKPYRARLAALTDILVTGLRHSAPH
jgi:hypothetical protein